MIAIFAGGDYSNGVSGFGPKIAHALAKCGFGDTLYEGCLRFDGIARRSFINRWLTGVREELQSNSQGLLRSREPILARNICEGLIPNNEIINLYLFPVTSFSPGYMTLPRDTWSVIIEPDIGRLAQAAAQHLSWSEPASIIKNFHGNVWEGIFLRMLFSVSV